ncbi:MYND-type domain-containing protein [Mycena sanguinolenta]|uniref:MYND-type domain-containing protein n=1 Tax=Mycena sanguinolenta TaxID=230812 RepID=A0A8H6Y3H0_9AGAR|nr:MYND-type domain-containing protein [Mycena sanguinolenta]
MLSDSNNGVTALDLHSTNEDVTLESDTLVPIPMTEEPSAVATEKPAQCDGCWDDVWRADAVQCPGCTKVYCTQRCLDYWADIHVRHCANPFRPLTTADKLAAAASEDMFTADQQTNEDYFFTRVRTPDDKTFLFGLYIGILRYHHVKPSTLHQWRLSGTMVENIKALYEPLPASRRGAYYPWFLKHLDIFEPRPNAVAALSARHLCESCGESAAVRCSACKKVWYCSKKCQESDWGGHLVNCNPGRPITTADHLRAAVHRGKLPDDLDSLSDYGFTRVGQLGANILLDVYRILFEDGVRSRDLHRWKNAGNLLEEVEKLLRRLERWKTSDVLPWFEDHRYAFDPTAAVPNHDEDDQALAVMGEKIERLHIQRWNQIGQFHSHNHDQILSYIKNHWPSEERTFFFFHALLLVVGHPTTPDFDMWVKFGFCACQDESEEGFLAATYRMLASYCSYEEFLSAYTSSTLIQLLDANGLRGRRMIHPYLEDVLSGSPSRFKSVWFLKQHLRCSVGTRSNLIPSVRVDYGFMNCASDSEYQELKDLYKDIFERRRANPLQLHEACLAGSLYEYVLRLFPEMKKKSRAKKFQRLLRNPYPLPNLRA